MRLNLILLAVLFSLALTGAAFAQANNSTEEEPPPAPSSCFVDSDCNAGYVCVDDACVAQGGEGGSGGGGRGSDPQNRYGRDWNWSGWEYPNSSNGSAQPPGAQPNNSSNGQEESPPSPPNEPGGNPPGSANAAADIPSQIASGIGDFLSAMIGDLGRNPIVIGIAAALALFAGLLALIGAYVYLIRKPKE